MRVGRRTNIHEFHTLHLLVEDLPRYSSAYFYLILEYNDYTIDNLTSRARWITDEEQLAKTKNRLCLGGGPPLFCPASGHCTRHSASFTLQHPSISRYSFERTWIRTPVLLHPLRPTKTQWLLQTPSSRQPPSFVGLLGSLLLLYLYGSQTVSQAQAMRVTGIM